jgi:hypothetical protein
MYFRYLELSRTVEVIQSNFLAQKFGFLDELRKPIRNFSRIETLGQDCYELLSETQRIYREMFVINPTAAPLRKYATFLSNLVGHDGMTRKVVRMADRLDAVKSVDPAFKNIEIGSLASMFVPSNAIVIISGEEGQVGTILDVNMGAANLFGWASPTEMIGSNANIIMPNPFARK